MVLRVQDIRKTFEEGTQKVEVLKGVSMDVAPGEVVALEGPSGSGKTTLLSIMGCILTPSSGDVQVAGERVALHDEARLREGGGGWSWILSDLKTLLETGKES